MRYFSMVAFCWQMLFGYSLSAQSEKLEDLIAGKQNFKEIQEIARNYFLQHPTEKQKVLKAKDAIDNEYIKYHRWEWHWKNRVMPDGSFPDLIKQWGIYEGLNAKLGKRTRGNDWKNISQTSSLSGYNGMGRLKAVAFHPTDTNIIYVGAPVGGIWKTTTGGNNWVSLGDDLPYNSVGNIVIDPLDPNLLFITIGDNESWSHYGLGVYKSTDGGLSWAATSQTSTFSNSVVYYKLMISPDNHNVLYSAQSNGFWKSIDGGTSWTLNRSGTYVDFEFKPFHPETIYLSRKGSGNSEIFKSIDDGTTWTQISTFASSSNTLEISVTPADSNYIGVGLENTSVSKFYLSTDGGLSPFILKNANIDDNAVIQFSATNKNRVYCGYVTNFRSIDEGTTWAQITNWYNDGVLPAVHADNHYAAINPLQPNYIYYCNDGGLYRYNEQNNQWKDLSNGLVITEFYKMAHSQQDSVFMIGGTQDNGGRKRTAINVWEATNGGDGMEVAVNPINDETIYTTYYGGQLYRSYDQWDQDTYYDISADPNSGAWVTPYMIDPIVPTTLIAGYNEVWRSTDEGDSWTKISSNITGSLSSNLEYLDVAPSNTNVIYTGFGDKVFYTSNMGSSWSTKFVPDSSGSFEDVSMVVVNPKKANTVYVTKAGYGKGSKVYMSNNNGTNWINVSYNLPNIPVNCIVFDRESDTTNFDIYIGTDVGVFFKQENDLSWQYYGSGMPNTQVSDLEIFYLTGKLRAATYGRGIWETEIKREVFPAANTNVNELAERVRILENPVKSELKLSFQLEKEDEFFLRLLDQSGKLMKSDIYYADSGLSVYSMPVAWLADGIYYLQLQNKSGLSSTIKILKN